MNHTPLQKAAQAVIDRWDSPSWKDQPHTANYIAELRKALDAEIAESVEPDFYTACAEHNGGWIPLPGYSNETEHGVKSRILEDARKEGWKGTIEGRLFALGWQVMPVYLHPPQPQATTPAPHPLHRNISQHEIDVLNSVQYVLEVALSPPSHTQWLADRAKREAELTQKDATK